MAAFALDREAGSFAQINVTPLVDVMLVLLIIFMLAAPMLTHKLTLNFGSESCQFVRTTCPKPSEPVNLSIKQTGELYWNGVALNRAELAQNLAILGQQNDPPPLTLRPEARTRYEVVAAVLAAAKNAKLQRISIESAR